MKGRYVFFIALISVSWLWVGYDVIHIFKDGKSTDNPIHILWGFVTGFAIFSICVYLVGYVGETLVSGTTKLAKILDKYFGI